MAHNINFNKLTGKHSFVTVKELAWHRLGQVVEHLTTSEDVIREAQLDYEVDLAPLEAIAFNDERMIVPNNWATYRTDTKDVFAVVGSKYTVVQNLEAFAFFDEVVKSGKAKYETAGVLGKGEVVFISAKINKHLSVKVKGKDDDVDLYMFLSLSHDGKSSIIAGITPIRIVCNNTLDAALRRNISKVSIRHTESYKTKLDEASRVLNLIDTVPDETQLLYDRLGKKTVTEEEFFSTLYLCYLNEDQRKKLDIGEEISTRAINGLKGISNYYFKHKTQQDIVDTGWGVYNAFTGYYQNILNIKDDKKIKDVIDGNDRNLKVLTSLNYNTIQEALNIGKVSSSIKALL